MLGIVRFVNVGPGGLPPSESSGVPMRVVLGVVHWSDIAANGCISYEGPIYWTGETKQSSMSLRNPVWKYCCVGILV